jgi:hypothetical protein
MGEMFLDRALDQVDTPAPLSQPSGNLKSLLSADLLVAVWLPQTAPSLVHLASAGTLSSLLEGWDRGRWARAWGVNVPQVGELAARDTLADCACDGEWP